MPLKARLGTDPSDHEVASDRHPAFSSIKVLRFGKINIINLYEVEIAQVITSIDHLCHPSQMLRRGDLIRGLCSPNSLRRVHGTKRSPGRCKGNKP